MKRVFLIILVIAILLISGCSGTTDSLIPEDLTQEQQAALERLDPNGLIKPETLNLAKSDFTQMEGLDTSMPNLFFQDLSNYYGINGQIAYYIQAGKIQKGRLLAIQYFIQIDNETERLQKCEEIITDIMTILGEPDKITLGNQDFSNRAVSFENMYALNDMNEEQKILYCWEDEDEKLYVESSVNSKLTSIVVDYGRNGMIV